MQYWDIPGGQMRKKTEISIQIEKWREKTSSKQTQKLIQGKVIKTNNQRRLCVDSLHIDMVLLGEK